LQQQQQEADDGGQPGCNWLHLILDLHPVATLAQILVWLQQRPEVLQLPALVAADGSVVMQGVDSYTALWAGCSAGRLYTLVQL
jgi:hypothetical protein